MHGILNPQRRRSKRFFERRTCPGCGERLAARPAFARHPWVAFVVSGLEVSWRGVEKLRGAHGRAFIHHGEDGSPFVVVTSGEQDEHEASATGEETE